MSRDGLEPSTLGSKAHTDGIPALAVRISGSETPAHGAGPDFRRSFSSSQVGAPCTFSVHPGALPIPESGQSGQGSGLLGNHKSRHPTSRFFGKSGQAMGVGVKGDADVRVPQTFRDHLGMEGFIRMGRDGLEPSTLGLKVR
jgi:hypothetical protein